MKKGRMELMHNTIERMKKKVQSRELIVAAGVDTVEVEKWCNDTDCMPILLYPTIKYQASDNRFLAGFLSFGSSNEGMIEMANSMKPMLKGQCLLAGIHCADPFIKIDILLDQIQKQGFIGIHNYPPLSLVDGNFGRNMESLGEGFAKELELLKKAKERKLFTCGMAATRKQAMQLAKMNVDMIVLYLGLGESFANRNKCIAYYIKKLQELIKAIRIVSSDSFIFFAAEQNLMVEDVEKIIKETQKIQGYLLLPITRKYLSEKQIKLEIKGLQTITY